LQDIFKEDEMIGNLNQLKHPRGMSFREGSEKSFPETILERFVYEWNAKVIGWKGATSEAQRS
jgi:hypothetical protein